MKTFGILGDSYSTFKNYIVEGNRRYYPDPLEVEDLLYVEQTWWHLLMQKRNLRLLVNDSYSGATVCEDVREGYPPESAFTKRAIRSFGPQITKKPDLIFLFGCTNDYWLDRESGKTQYSGWNDQDLQRTVPAFCYVLHHLQEANPDSKLVVLINDEFTPKYAEPIIQAAKQYNALVVELKNISKQTGHPDALGMTQIFQQVDAALDLI